MTKRRKTVEGEAYVTVGQAAEELDLSPSTVRRKCDTGRLRFLMDPSNKFRYVSEKSVAAYKGRWIRLDTTEDEKSKKEK